MKEEMKPEVMTPEEMAPDVLAQWMELFPEMSQEEVSVGLEELRTEYPDVEIETLCKDELFILFVHGKMLDIVTIYADYLAFCTAVEKRVTEKLRVRTNRATGSGRARTSAASAGLSDGQYAFLNAWNREHPEYAMTAKEYAAALQG